MFHGLCDSLKAVARLTNDLESRFGFEYEAQSSSNYQVIVREQNPHS
jgi:hypothetical protein